MFLVFIILGVFLFVFVFVKSSLRPDKLSGQSLKIGHDLFSKDSVFSLLKLNEAT